MLNITPHSTITLTLKINMSIPTNMQFVVTGTGCTYSLASVIDPNIDAIHASNLPVLDPNVSADPVDLDYIALRGVENNQTLILATDWIESIVTLNTADYVMSLKNISSSEYQGIVKLLNNYGLKDRFTLVSR